MEYRFRTMLQLVANSPRPTPAPPLRVVVVSRDRFARAGLVATLDGMSVLADLEPGALLASRLRVLKPDAVLSDVSIECDLPVVLITSDPAAGAEGVLSPAATAEQIAAALRAVAVGLHVTEQPEVSPIDTEPLTHRELEVLHLLAEGVTNREIAQRLAISEHTVKFHVNAILTKLGAATRTEAVVHAARLGILTL
jgi:DNA-binding CsgD family transcriptional regulator